MDAETLYTINGGQLVALTQGPVVPRGIGAAIAANLDSFVTTPGLIIGSWDQTVQRDRPAVMSFTDTGTVVSVVVARMEADAQDVAERIAAIHAWLAPMQLRDLSQLFTEPGAFYEGLWDMSPNATIALQETRRYVVVTAETDTATLEAVAGELPGAELEFVHLDVFTSDMVDDPIIRWSAVNDGTLTPPRLDLSDSADSPSTLHTVVMSPPAVETTDAAADEPLETESAVETTESDTDVEVEVDEDLSASVPDVPAPETVAITPQPDLGESEDMVVDLTGDPEAGDLDLAEMESADVTPGSGRTSGHEAAGATFIPGRTYEIGSLPLLFDPNDNQLESISDEMFGVPGHLVLVDKLPERRRQPSPFENPGRYRWDATTGLQTMLETHSTDATGDRAIHLFVESDRQPGLATYVGLLTTAEDNQAGRYSNSLWFDIDPKVSAPLWQLFRKGRLPELQDATADS